MKIQKEQYFFVNKFLIYVVMWCHIYYIYTSKLKAVIYLKRKGEQKAKFLLFVLNRSQVHMRDLQQLII